MMNNAIVSRKLEIKYPDNTLIKINDINIDVGETILLTGNTGSGKTTLLQTIYGAIPRVIEAEINGSLEVLQRNPGVENIDWIIKNIGYIPQEPWDGILTHTVKTEISLFSVIRKNRIPHIFIDIYKKKMDKTTYTLSSGESQKLNILTRLLLRPKILLLDEPLAFLDKKSKDELKKTIMRLQKESYTIIISEHKKDEWSNIKYKEISLRNQERELIRIDHEKLIDLLTNTNTSDIPMISLSNISYKYPLEEEYVINDFYFKFEGPGLILVKGPNGSGKTTLLKIIAGMIRPKGKRIVKGKPILLPDNPLLFYSYPTVQEEIGDKWFDKIADIFNLHLFKSKGLKQLSTGERKLIALASLLKKNKNILLLDEPTVGLDKYNALQIKKIIEIMSEKRLIIIATHEDIFDDIADYTIEMKKHDEERK